jgi:hypothetical protein
MHPNLSKTTDEFLHDFHQWLKLSKFSCRLQFSLVAVYHSPIPGSASQLKVKKWLYQSPFLDYVGSPLVV